MRKITNQINKGKFKHLKGIKTRIDVNKNLNSRLKMPMTTIRAYRKTKTITK